MGVWYKVLMTVGWDLEVPKGQDGTHYSLLGRALFVRLRELGVWIPRLALDRARGQCPFVSSGMPREDSETQPCILDLLGDTQFAQRTLSRHLCAVLTVPELKRVMNLFERNRSFYYALFDLCHDPETWALAHDCPDDGNWAVRRGGASTLTRDRLALLKELEERIPEREPHDPDPRDWEDPNPNREHPTRGSPHRQCQSTLPTEVPMSSVSGRSCGWGSLPEHVLVSVFENLDGVSTWRASRVCQRWACVALGEELQVARGFPDPIMIALPDIV